MAPRPPSEHADLKAPARKLTSVSLMNKLTGSLHYHACSGCKYRVYSCACKNPAVNGRCQVCSDRRRPLWEASRDPQDCCTRNVTQVTRLDELERYRLAGPGPWFQCKTCARCHGEPPQRGTE